MQKRPPDNNLYVKTCSKNPKKTKWWYHGSETEDDVRRWVLVPTKCRHFLYFQTKKCNGPPDPGNAVFHAALCRLVVVSASDILVAKESSQGSFQCFVFSFFLRLEISWPVSSVDGFFFVFHSRRKAAPSLRIRILVSVVDALLSLF